MQRSKMAGKGKKVVKAAKKDKSHDALKGKSTKPSTPKSKTPATSPKPKSKTPDGANRKTPDGATVKTPDPNSIAEASGMSIGDSSLGIDDESVDTLNYDVKSLMSNIKSAGASNTNAPVTPDAMNKSATALGEKSSPNRISEANPSDWKQIGVPVELQENMEARERAIGSGHAIIEQYNVPKLESTASNLVVWVDPAKNADTDDDDMTTEDIFKGLRVSGGGGSKSPKQRKRKGSEVLIKDLLDLDKRGEQAVHHLKELRKRLVEEGRSKRSMENIIKGLDLTSTKLEGEKCRYVDVHDIVSTDDEKSDVSHKDGKTDDDLTGKDDSHTEDDGRDTKEQVLITLNSGSKMSVNSHGFGQVPDIDSALTDISMIPSAMLPSNFSQMPSESYIPSGSALTFELSGSKKSGVNRDFNDGSERELSIYEEQLDDGSKEELKTARGSTRGSKSTVSSTSGSSQSSLAKKSIPSVINAVFSSGTAIPIGGEGYGVALQGLKLEDIIAAEKKQEEERERERLNPTPKLQTPKKPYVAPFPAVVPPIFTTPSTCRVPPKTPSSALRPIVSRNRGLESDADDEDDGTAGEEQDDDEEGKGWSVKAGRKASKFRTFSRGVVYTNKMEKELDPTTGAFIVNCGGGPMDKLVFDKNTYKRDTRAYSGLTPRARTIMIKQAELRTPSDLAYLIEVVERLKCFRRYSRKIKHELARVIIYECYDNGRRIVKEGQPGISLYFIVTGGAYVMAEEANRATGQKVNQIVAEMYEGSCFGELALLHNLKRSASIISKGRSEFLKVDKADFDTVLRQCHEAAWRERVLAIACIPQFADWPRNMIEHVNKASRMKEYPGNVTVYGDCHIENPDEMYFSVKGECQIVRTVNLYCRTSTYGKKTFFVEGHPAVKEAIRQQKSAEHNGKGRRTALRSNELWSMEKRFWSIGVIGKGFYFCVGENFKKTFIVTRTRSEFLLVPVIHFVKAGQSRLLEKMKEDLNNTLPDDRILLERFQKEMAWENYKMDCVDSVVSRNMIPRTTTLFDVPQAIRHDHGKL